MADKKKKVEEDSLDILTVFIIVMGICSLVIGLWAVIAYSRMKTNDRLVEQAYEETAKMKRLIASPLNMQYWGTWTKKTRDVTPETLSSYLTKSAKNCKIADRVFHTGTLRRGKTSGAFTEWYIQISLRNLTLKDLHTFIRQVEYNSPEVRVKDLDLRNFKKGSDDKGEFVNCNAVIHFNIYSRTKPAAAGK